MKITYYLILLFLLLFSLQGRQEKNRDKVSLAVVVDFYGLATDIPRQELNSIFLNVMSSPVASSEAETLDSNLVIPVEKVLIFVGRYLNAKELKKIKEPFKESFKKKSFENSFDIISQKENFKKIALNGEMNFYHLNKSFLNRYDSLDPKNIQVSDEKHFNRSYQIQAKNKELVKVDSSFSHYRIYLEKIWQRKKIIPKKTPIKLEINKGQHVFKLEGSLKEHFKTKKDKKIKIYLPSSDNNIELTVQLSNIIYI